MALPHGSVPLGMPGFVCLVNAECWTEWVWLMMLWKMGREVYKGGSLEHEGCCWLGFGSVS